MAELLLKRTYLTEIRREDNDQVSIVR